ncbi:heme ABC transporter ATP-binding protein [Sneathiella marina]|uniref:Heme ABC transporter ATP-binding protein n=1 Tax=Sneathiella marina TaxID=2950108 RepID=A0ABY4VXP5_9PROT|nr:heme ABC transporter ATP-binding protein [Sneathiella marina]USG59544.1 heme ABC transporter ATP-binding protein [Sneathiella marina]
MIAVSNVSFRVGRQLILDNVSATFEAGKVSAILGPNGAGKTTLLKCITGSLAVDHGAISIEGRKLEEYSLEELSMKRAVLSQNTPISFPFTAEEIVFMGRNPYALKKNNATDTEIVHETLDLMDAWHLRERSFPTLSGGEQQRVQFARVLSQIWDREKAYLFLDEPTSALDLKHQYQVMELIRQQCANKYLTVIMVMHDLNIAYQSTDKSYFLRDGHVHNFGDSKEVINAETLSEVYNLPITYAARHINFHAI